MKYETKKVKILLLLIKQKFKVYIYYDNIQEFCECIAITTISSSLHTLTITILSKSLNTCI